ncbi:MAG TPA: chemotaxis protein CheW [Candidatus Limnocylindrales bacterium]|nr:chemotaxis protein CheW [Candidatus Limnocylindrales bacterium]
MKLAAQDSGKRHARHSEQVILFSIARRTFAIAAESVQEIRSTDSLAGAASELEQEEVAKVHHIIERARRTYYVVSGCAHFRLPVTRPTLALILRQFRVAVLVDEIERIAEIPAVYALPRGFVGEERAWYRGLAYLEDHIIPVVNPGGFLTRDEFARLDGVVRALESQHQMEGAAQ